NPETGKPFESLTELQGYQAKKARRRKANRKLEELINVSLNVLEKDISWLAERIGKSKGSVYSYANGKTIPKPPTLRKIFRELQTPFKTLEDLVEDKGL
ncbi:MAG: helix-turn-helix transcriptional regulator, partial [Nanoarchaeota archaeon]